MIFFIVSNDASIILYLTVQNVFVCYMLLYVVFSVLCLCIIERILLAAVLNSPTNVHAYIEAGVHMCKLVSQMKAQFDVATPSVVFEQVLHALFHETVKENENSLLTRLNEFTRSCLFNASAVQYRTSIN